MKSIILQIPEFQSEELIKTLENEKIEIRSKDEINSFDGATLIEVVVTITPVIALALERIITAWQNGKREIVINKKGKIYKGYKASELKEILNSEQ